MQNGANIHNERILIYSNGLVHSCRAAWIFPLPCLGGIHREKHPAGFLWGCENICIYWCGGNVLMHVSLLYWWTINWSVVFPAEPPWSNPMIMKSALVKLIIFPSWYYLNTHHQTGSIPATLSTHTPALYSSLGHPLIFETMVTIQSRHRPFKTSSIQSMLSAGRRDAWEEHSVALTLNRTLSECILIR